MDHIINRTFGGGEETGWIQDVCSCGWKSKQYFAYQDLQYSLCKSETSEHIRAASNNKFNSTRGSDSGSLFNTLAEATKPAARELT